MRTAQKQPSDPLAEMMPARLARVVEAALSELLAQAVGLTMKMPARAIEARAVLLRIAHS
jgi:hypothetical protein